jgi:anti-sigma B factor antagonist
MLKVDRRFYGSITIVRCAGVIAADDSLDKLEEELRHSVSETDRMVVDLRGVDRLDSTGMGLLVRFLSRIREKGGDLRLCSPTEFVRKLLSATKLDSVFLVYTSDYNAIASFFVRAAPGDERHDFTRTVLFFDPSDDVCAFARSVLGQQGYEVLTTNSVAEAQLLAQAAGPSAILATPQAAEQGSEALLPELRAAAPDVPLTILPADFGQKLPDDAAAALLKAVSEREQTRA